MRRLFLTPAFLLLFLMVGCDMPEAAQVSATLPLVQTTTPTEAEIIYLDLRIEMPNQTLGMFEPAQGVLLGINVQFDPIVASIADAEAATGTQHAIFAHEMRLGDDFPLRWVLENIAARSAPLITLHPPETGEPFDIELLDDFVSYISLFLAPAFVQLYPLQTKTDFTSEEYIAFFRLARSLFAQYAPNVALVWGFDSTMLPSAFDFFPGEDAIHWINMTSYNMICPEGEFESITDNLASLTDTFGSYAPLMLTTAVASYSMISNRHFPAEAAQKLTALYASLANFPRIRAIVYQNYSDLPGRGADFRINASGMLKDAYQAATALSRFIQTAPYGVTAQTDTIVHQSPHSAVARGYRFYIPTNAINLPQAQHVLINGQVYHPLVDVLSIQDGDFYVNLIEGTLTLFFNP